MLNERAGDECQACVGVDAPIPHEYANGNALHNFQNAYVYDAHHCAYVDVHAQFYRAYAGACLTGQI